MSHHDLLEYVRAAKAAGATDGEITVRLVDAGWYTVDAQDALALYAKLTVAPEVQQSAPEPVAEFEPVAHIISEQVVEEPDAELAMARRAAHMAKPRHAATYDPMIVAIAALAFCVGFIGFILLAK